MVGRWCWAVLVPERSTNNTELNDLRKIICMKKSIVSIEKFQFVKSLKIWRCTAYTVCHAHTPMTS